MVQKGTCEGEKGNREGRRGPVNGRRGPVKDLNSEQDLKVTPIGTRQLKGTPEARQGDL